jgi:hypothetical protein
MQHGGEKAYTRLTREMYFSIFFIRLVTGQEFINLFTFLCYFSLHSYLPLPSFFLITTLLPPSYFFISRHQTIIYFIIFYNLFFILSLSLY